MNRSLETIILDHPEIFEIHQKCSENGDKQFELFIVDFSDIDDFCHSKSFLCTNKQINKLFELFFIAE